MELPVRALGLSRQWTWSSPVLQVFTVILPFLLKGNGIQFNENSLQISGSCIVANEITTKHKHGVLCKIHHNWKLQVNKSN